MSGTFAFCRTKEAIKRMDDWDIIQNLTTEQYFKKEKGKVFISTDCYNWNLFAFPMETFPPYTEWRSLSNLHYYEDLKNEAADQTLCYLSQNEEILDEHDSRVDKSKKRWFVGAIFE